MEKQDKPKIEYINTPFAYTKQQQGLTLLQQNIMNRISAHLQVFFNEYWHNAELRNSKDDPRTFMTDEQIQNLKPIRIELSELGISSGTYERVSEARNAILNITLNGIVVDEDSGPNDRAWNVISRIDMPITDHGVTVMRKDREFDENGRVRKVGEAKKTEAQRYRGYMDIYLNRDLVKSMLNITLGYVTHPENIARMGRVPNMPLMYYFLRHHMNNFKLKNGKPVTQVKVELAELREYLGLTKRNAKGEVVQEKYQKYSQFKSKVMSVALADIKRVCEEGLIDFYFDVTEVRPRGKQRGTPSYLVFDKVQVKPDREYREASANKLCETLLKSYPTLDASVLKSFCADVPEEQWEDFKNYAYYEVPKAVERPHKWNGTHEDFVYYLLKNWNKKPKKQASVQRDLFGNPVEPEQDKPKAVEYTARYVEEWQRFVSEYSGSLKEVLQRGKALGTPPRGYLNVLLAEDDARLLNEAGDEWTKAREAFKQLAGIKSKYGPGVQIMTKR